MFFIKKLLLLTLITLSLNPLLVKAENFGIVAVVDGKIITNYMLKERIELIITTSKLDDSSKMQERIARQALQIIINEKLQEEDGKNLGIQVTDNDLNFAIQDLEAKNNLAKGGFDSFIEAQDISKAALMEQIKAQILWKKIVNRAISPKIILSDYEIEDAIAQISSTNTTEVFLSEITLQGVEAEQNALLKTLAERFIEELKQGKEFSAIANQFSTSTTASQGGVIGWVPEESLEDDLKDLVKNTPNNTIIPPISRSDGYLILKVGERRNSTSKPDENRVRDILMMQKIELESKRYMKNLRDNTFIEIRI